MHDKPTTTDPIVATKAAAEDAAVAELRAFVGLMVAKSEAAHPDALLPAEEGEVLA